MRVRLSSAGKEPPPIDLFYDEDFVTVERIIDSRMVTDSVHRELVAGDATAVVVMTGSSVDAPATMHSFTLPS